MFTKRCMQVRIHAPTKGFVIQNKEKLENSPGGNLNSSAKTIYIQLSVLKFSNLKVQRLLSLREPSRRLAMKTFGIQRHSGHFHVFRVGRREGSRRDESRCTLTLLNFSTDSYIYIYCFSTTKAFLKSLNKLQVYEIR